MQNSREAEEDKEGGDDDDAEQYPSAVSIPRAVVVAVRVVAAAVVVVDVALRDDKGRCVWRRFPWKNGHLEEGAIEFLGLAMKRSRSSFGRV
jgi:hypothetical protein